MFHSTGLTSTTSNTLMMPAAVMLLLLQLLSTPAALSSWVAHAAGVYGRALSPRDLQQLAASVRLPGMGPCYLSYVALQHDWFRLSLDVAALARAAAFSAAASEVRADFLKHTRDSISAAEKAAAVAAATGHAGDGGGSACSGSSSSSQAGGRLSACCTCSNDPTAFTAGASSSITSSSITPGVPAGPWGISSSSSRFCSWCQQQQVCSVDQQLQLLQLAHAAQRPRAASCKRSCFFQWHVDVAAIRQLYEEVAAAGSRDSRILRSPAHSFAGYEWALQLEITQTKGATGFDGSKPWALGVFLTCQVRVEVPNKQPAEVSSGAAAAAGAGNAAAGGGEGAGSGSAAGAEAAGRGGCGGSSSSSKVPGMQQQQVAQAAPSSPLLMQLVDFGFVSTAATISVREVGGKDKRCEKSWEHATVRGGGAAVQIGGGSEWEKVACRCVLQACGLVCLLTATWTGPHSCAVSSLHGIASANKHLPEQWSIGCFGPQGSNSSRLLFFVTTACACVCM
jgi:hypothetical protein